jgi:DNA-binding beta-propeller fold protein YncE
MPVFLYALLLPALVGAGSESKFAVVEGWAKVSAGWSFTMVSNISGDSRGRIYVASRGEHPIAIFEPDGRLVGTMGERDIPPTMNYNLTVSPPQPISVKRWVHGIHVDPWDNVWVTDLARHIVLKFSPQGKLLLTLGTPGQSGESPAHFFQPSSVAVGRTGDVFVADGYGNARVVKFSADGKFVRAWGKKGSAPGEFDTPHCVALDARGRVYVAERMNNRVSVFAGDVLDHLDGGACPGSPVV